MIVTFMKRRFADELRRPDEKEMPDMTVPAQSGPIAVIAAVRAGRKTAGFPGMLATVPPFFPHRSFLRRRRIRRYSADPE